MRRRAAPAPDSGVEAGPSAPGTAPGMWLEPDVDPSLDPAGAAGKSVVLACGAVAYAGASNATLVIEASWGNATDVQEAEAEAEVREAKAPVIALQLDTAKGPRFPGENPSAFWTAAPMTDRNLDFNYSHRWLPKTADLEASGDLDVASVFVPAVGDGAVTSTQTLLVLM